MAQLIPRTPQAPRHLTDQEEQALVAAVSEHGSLRDRTLLVVALHTGLRAEELCRLKADQVHLGRRSGHMAIYGKRNKYREVPLNSTVREALTSYLQTLPSGATYVFPSRKHSTDVVSPIGERVVPLHRLAQIMGHDSLDTTLRYVGGTKQDLQQAVETIAWA